MPVAQSLELLGAYERAGLPVRFVPLHGAKHGGREFYDEPRLALVREFLARAGIAPLPRP
jgi:dipeptidyl aminopeptidase/acylaminoacyl peptidase